MDVLGWLWWLVTSLLGLVWTVAWFLLGGWVATLAQIAVLTLIIFGYKYGWRRAPQEVMSRLSTVGRYAWAWIRAREVPRAAPAQPGPRDLRSAGGLRRAQPGDVHINISTMLSVLMLAGLGLMAAIK